LLPFIIIVKKIEGDNGKIILNCHLAKCLYGWPRDV